MSALSVIVKFQSGQAEPIAVLGTDKVPNVIEKLWTKLENDKKAEEDKKGESSSSSSSSSSTSTSSSSTTDSKLRIPKKAKLFYKEKPLDDTKTLDEQKVETESILMFVPGLEDKDKIQLGSTCQVSALAKDKAATDFLVMISMKAPVLEDVQRAPMDLVLVVDRSGSMSSLMAIVIETMEFIIKNLQMSDRLSIVDYDDRITTTLPLTLMDTSGKDLAVKRAKTLTSRGGTNLSGGLFRGLQLVHERSEPKNNVTSVLLFTDGQANEGLTTSTAIVNAMETQSYLNQSFKGGEFDEDDEDSDPFQQQQQYVQQKPVKQSQASGGLLSNILKSSTPNKQSKSLQVSQMQQKRKSAPLVPTQASPKKEEKQKPKEEKDTPKKETATPAGPLNCTVNTFGFGANHNAELLKAISRAGSGLYFYIENNNAIGDAFVDCMGGLLSTVGQELKLQFRPEGKVELVDIITQFPKTTNSDGSTTVLIKDLQSEESRDLLCKVNVPAASDSETETKLLTGVLSYFNVIGNVRDQQSVTAVVTRLDSKDPTLADVKVDFNIDKQRNRVLAAEALKKGNELGSAGKLQEGRDLFEKTINELKSSISGGDPFVVDLIQGLQTAASSLKSQSEYSAWGSKNMLGQSEAHYQQRSNMQAKGYANVKKAKMKAGWDSFQNKH